MGEALYTLAGPCRVSRGHTGQSLSCIARRRGCNTVADPALGETRRVRMLPNGLIMHTWWAFPGPAGRLPCSPGGESGDRLYGTCGNSLPRRGLYSARLSLEPFPCFTRGEARRPGGPPGAFRTPLAPRISRHAAPGGPPLYQTSWIPLLDSVWGSKRMAPCRAAGRLRVMSEMCPHGPGSDIRRAPDGRVCAAPGDRRRVRDVSAPPVLPGIILYGFGGDAIYGRVFVRSRWLFASHGGHQAVAGTTRI